MGVDFLYEHHSFKWIETLPNGYCSDCGGTAQADRTYTPDFFVYPATPYEFIIETKGIFTPKDRKIAIAMKEQHPLTDMRYLFYYDNKLTKNSKTRYTDWTAKQGLKCGVRSSMDKTLREWCEK